MTDILAVQLYPHIPPPGLGDGDILRARLPTPSYGSQKALPLPLGKPHHCQTRVRCQDLIYVRRSLAAGVTSFAHVHFLVSFVAILFVDALQRMWRVSAESDLAKSTGSGVQDVRGETNLAARKF